MTSLYKAIAASQDYINKELGDGIGDDPMLCSNLHLCYTNARLARGMDDWMLFLAHLCWPEDNEFPEHLFLVEPSQVPGYKRAMQRIEELYE